MNESVILTSGSKGADDGQMDHHTTTLSTLDSEDSALPGAKRRRVEEDENNCASNLRSLLDIETVLKDVPAVLTPPDDPSFARQMDYLSTFHRSIEGSSESLSWENLAGAISNFLSYHMIRKIYGEDAEGQRSAARSMYNLVHHCKTNEIVTAPNLHNKETNECDALLRYTESLAAFPHENAIELQKLWDTFYWEKKENVYPYLRKSNFSLQPGDTFIKEVDGKEEVVRVKESDMIMTRGDINSKGPVKIYLALARVCGVLLRYPDAGASTREFNVRGENIRINCGHHPKEDAAYHLEEYRVSNRDYEKLLIDEYGGRIQIAKVCKNGWYMKPEGMHGNGVFVPLTAKVAKLGVSGAVFSGMRLGLAGGIWRPLPSGQDYDHTICYNVYPPDFYDFQS